MLQPVVADDDVELGMRAQQGVPDGDAIGADRDRNPGAPAQQQRLVADALGACVGVDHERPPTPARP